MKYRISPYLVIPAGIAGIQGQGWQKQKKPTAMRDEYDFSQAKCAQEVPHLTRLQEAAKGKSRITIMLDNDVLMAFWVRADAEGIGYQTLINQALRETLNVRPVNEATLRKILREELWRLPINR